MSTGFIKLANFLAYKLFVQKGAIFMSENLDLKIRAEMRKRRMTFKELAALIGISGAYLSDILNGNRDGKKAQQHIDTEKRRLDIG